MLQKYLFFEILNSEDPKKYEEFKNLVNYDFLIYFTKKRENNSKIDDFNLLNSYEKIFINKFSNSSRIFTDFNTAIIIYKNTTIVINHRHYV